MNEITSLFLFLAIGPLFNVTSAIISTAILINACHYCTVQKVDLIKNIEKLTFWAGDNDKLHYAKQELLSQINNLDISISGKGFFIVNRQFLAGVSVYFNLNFEMVFLQNSRFTDGSRLLYVHHYIHSILSGREVDRSWEIIYLSEFAAINAE